MSLKGYILPVAVVGIGVAFYGVPKARSYVSELRHAREVREVRHVTAKVYQEWEQQHKPVGMKTEAPGINPSRWGDR